MRENNKIHKIKWVKKRKTLKFNKNCDIKEKLLNFLSFLEETLWSAQEFHMNQEYTAQDVQIIARQ